MIKCIILAGKSGYVLRGEKTELVSNLAVCHQDQLYQQHPCWLRDGRGWQGLLLRYSPAGAGRPAIGDNYLALGTVCFRAILFYLLQILL